MQSSDSTGPVPAGTKYVAVWYYAVSNVKRNMDDRSALAHPRCCVYRIHEERLRGDQHAEIATRARVSKRELYAVVGNKQEMLIACIGERATRLKVPADLPVPRDRETLAQVLASFGTQLVREITDPTVITVFRLAIADAVRAPEVAQALDSVGREASRAALRQIMTQAQAAGLLEVDLRTSPNSSADCCGAT